MNTIRPFSYHEKSPLWNFLSSRTVGGVDYDTHNGRFYKISSKNFLLNFDSCRCILFEIQYFFAIMFENFIKFWHILDFPISIRIVVLKGSVGIFGWNMSKLTTVRHSKTSTHVVKMPLYDAYINHFISERVTGECNTVLILSSSKIYFFVPDLLLIFTFLVRFCK